MKIASAIFIVGPDAFGIMLVSFERALISFLKNHAAGDRDSLKRKKRALIPVHLNRFRNLDERLGDLVEPPELKTDSQNFPGTVVFVGVGETVGVGTGVPASSSAGVGAT